MYLMLLRQQNELNRLYLIDILLHLIQLLVFYESEPMYIPMTSRSSVVPGQYSLCTSSFSCAAYISTELGATD